MGGCWAGRAFTSADNAVGKSQHAQFVHHMISCYCSWAIALQKQTCAITHALGLGSNGLGGRKEGSCDAGLAGLA